VVLNIFWLAAHFSSETFLRHTENRKLLQITPENFSFCVKLAGFENFQTFANNHFASTDKIDFISHFS